VNRALAATGRSVRRLLFYIVLPLVVLGLVVWEFLLPDLADRAAHAWLSSLDQGDIDFTVEHIDLDDATIRGVSLADGALTVDRISLDYAPERLRGGQADRMTVSGLRWATRLVDGKLDLGPLQQLIAGEADDAAAPSSGFSVPVPEIELRDAEVVLATDAGELVFPLTASVRLSGDGGISGSASVRPVLPFGALAADISFDRETADATLELFIEISDGWLRAPAISALGLSGQIALRLDPRGGPSSTGYVEVAHLHTPLGDLPGAATFAVDASTAQISLNLVTTDGALALGASADASMTPRPTLDFSVEVAGLSDAALERRSFSIIEVGRPAPRLLVSGRAETDNVARLLGAKSIVEAASAIEADGVVELAVSELSVPRLVQGLDVQAMLTFALASGAAIVDAETLSLSAQKFDGQLFGVAPGDLAHAYLSGGGALTFTARDGPALTAIADKNGQIDMSIAGDLHLDLGEILALHAGANRIYVVANPDAGALSWQTVEQGELAIDRWSGRPFGLSLVEARATVEGVGGAFMGAASLEARGDLQWPGGLVAEDSRLSLATSLDFGGDHVTVRLQRSDIASFGAISVPGDVPISIGAIALTAEKSPSKPVLDVRFAEDGGTRFSAGLSLAPIRVDATAAPPNQPVTTLAFDVPALTLAADGRVRSGAGLEYLATVNGSGGKASMSTEQELAPGLPMKVTAENIALSVSAATGAPISVTLEAGRIAQAAQRPLLAPLRVSMAARIDAGIAEFDARLREGSGNLVIDVNGRHDVERDQGSGTIELFPLLFLEEGLQPGRLVPYFAPRLGLTTGSVSLSGPVAWSDAGVTSDLLLTIEDLNTAFDAVTVAGVNAAITIDRLMPPSTPPSQLVAIAGVDLGLPLTDGLVSIRLDRDGKPLVERSQFQWAGGQVATSLSRADVSGKTDLLVLEIDGIALDQLLDLTPQGSNIDSTGTLFGRIPVVFRDGAFVIVDGWLESSFEGGEIRYAADELAPGLLAGGDGVGLLLDALDNFHYSRLRVDLSGLPDGETEMRFRIRGANPELYGGAEVELNMGITGQLEQILRQSYEAYYTVPEEVARKLAGAAKRQAEDGQ